MKKAKLLFIMIISLLSYSHSQEIVSYSSSQTTGCSGIIANNANVTVNGICRGPGITKAPGLTGPYKSRDWTMGSEIDTDDYLEWTITPNIGFSIDLSSMNIRYGRTSNGPSQVEIQIDFGSGFTTIYTDTSVSETGEMNTIDLSTFACITSTITFRLFAFNATNAIDTFGIREYATTNKGIIINGIVKPACCTSTTTWTIAGGWDNGVPDLTKEAILAEDYSTSDGGFTSCSLTIGSGVKLVIKNNDHIEVNNDIINTGMIRIKPQGALVQKNNTATFINSSTATNPVIVDKLTAPMQEWYEYTYWSSPLENVTIGDFLPTTSSYRLFKFVAANFSDVVKEDLNNNVLISGRDDIDDNSNDWVTISRSTVMAGGIGYSATLGSDDLKELPAGSEIIRRFKGSVLNSGIVNVTVERNDDDPTNMDNNWNLLGNPFASAIDATMFFNQNIYDAVTNPTGALEGAIYFWSHVTPPSETTNGNEPLNFDVNDYAILNLTGNTAGERYAPDDYIPSGQGFFVSFSNDYPSNTGNVVFTNEMRVTGNNDKFFKEEKKHNKLWLNLTSDNGVYSQVLIGYIDGASKANDGSLYDAERIFSGDSAMLYSTIENDENTYAIQGRSPEDLNKKESIGLGVTTAISSSTLYTISIDRFEGKFFNNKTIYLKDYVTGIIHNLKKSDYTFISEIGSFKERFEIVFKNSEDYENSNDLLSIIELQNNKVKFSLKGNRKIKKIVISDTYGREVFITKVNKKVYTANFQNLNNAMYIATIVLNDATYISRQFIKK